MTLIFSYGTGVGAGIYMVRHKRYCFVIVGAYLGAILSLFLFNLFVYEILPFMIFSAVLFAVINYFFRIIITILSTSITGAYMTIRGISFILGGFPSEVLIYTILKNKQYDKVSAVL